MKKIIIAIIIFLAGILFVTSGFLLFNDNSIPDQLEVSYPYVGKYQNGIVSVSDGKNVYYLNNKNKIIYEFKKEIFSSQTLSNFYYQYDYGIISKEDKLGIIDKKGKEIIKPLYMQIEIIDKDTFLVTTDDGMSYFINDKEKRISNGDYYSIGQLSTDLFSASFNGKTGVINKKGDVIIPCEYDYIQEYKSDIIIASNSNGVDTGKLYKIKKDSVEEIEVPKFISYTISKDYLQLRDSQGKYYLYNYETGKTIHLNYSYVMLGNFSHGLAYASNDGISVGYINEKEEVIIPSMYSASIITDFNEYGYAIVAKEVGESIIFGLIDTKNNEILPFIYDDIVVLSKDLVAVLKDNVYTLQNITLNKPIENQYTTVETTIRDNLFVVSEGSYDNLKYGLIDEKGNEIYRPIYENIVVYEDQIVISDGNKSIIDFKN